MSKKKTTGGDRHGKHHVVRIPLELYERLRKYAEHTERTVTKEVIRAIRAMLDQHEGPEEGPDA
jgi:predicted DNA-binding protein